MTRLRHTRGLRNRARNGLGMPGHRYSDVHGSRSGGMVTGLFPSQLRAASRTRSLPTRLSARIRTQKKCHSKSDRHQHYDPFHFCTSFGQNEKNPPTVKAEGSFPITTPSRPRGHLWGDRKTRVFWLPLLPTLRAFPERQLQWHSCGFRPRLQLRGSDGFAPSSAGFSHFRLRCWMQTKNM